MHRSELRADLKQARTTALLTPAADDPDDPEWISISGQDETAQTK
jgi:hypothetical protein